MKALWNSNKGAFIFPNEKYVEYIPFGNFFVKID